MRYNGILVGSLKVNIEFLFVAEFKALHTLAGGFGARSKRTYIWCNIQASKIDHNLEISEKGISPSSEIMDLRNCNRVTEAQKGFT